MSLRIGSREFTREQTIFIAVVAVLVLLLLLIVVGVLPGGKNKAEKVELTVWGLDEDTRVWRTTINRFRDSYPNVTVSFTAVDPEGYEGELLNALAAGRGPDIFMFSSKWLIEHGDKVVPAPSSKITANTFSGLFPQVAEQDFVAGDRIYAMPLFIDTLALVYNRDIFDRKGVVFPPKSWGEFEEAVTKIRVFENGVITERAAAIGGTSRSVSNAVDLLGLLMMQNNSAIVNDAYTRAAIGREGEQGLIQYTKFANSQDPLYTWSDSFGSSNEAFANEEVAMVFAYPGDVREIRDKNPFLDFKVSKAPQVNESNPVNFANYWGLAASSASANQDAAWDFVIFTTTDITSAEDYATQTGHSPALRLLINNYLNNPNVGVFAEQALTAQSWPQPNDDGVNSIFDAMISNVTSGEMTPAAAVGDAQAKLTELIRR